MPLRAKSARPAASSTRGIKKFKPPHALAPLCPGIATNRRPRDEQKQNGGYYGGAVKAEDASSVHLGRISNTSRDCQAGFNLLLLRKQGHCECTPKGCMWKVKCNSNGSTVNCAVLDSAVESGSWPIMMRTNWKPGFIYILHRNETR